jgi:hypothetical protein
MLNKSKSKERENMKKYFIPILAVISLALILGFVALFSGNPRINYAQGLNTTDEEMAVNNEVPSQPAFINSQKADPSIEQNQQNEIIIIEIQTLTKRWYEENVKSGWIHVIIHINNDYDIINTLPDNSILDKEYIMDDWILLDENGYQISAVNIMRSIDGNPMQIAVLRDNTWNNLTYDIISPVAEETLPLEFSVDSGFPDQAIRLVNCLKRESTYLDGVPVILYTITEEYEPAMRFLDFNDLVSASIIRAYYEPNSGALLLYEQALMMANDMERIRSSARIEEFETGLEPAIDIITYLR